MESRSKDIMAKKIVTIRNLENLAAARRLMLEKRIRHLPVVNESDEIVGMVSSHEAALAAVSPHARLEHVMSAPVEFISESLSVKDAVYRLLEKKISSLIVVDENREAVGILTSDDLLLYLAHMLDKESAKPWFDTLKQQTIGRVIDQLSSMGI